MNLSKFFAALGLACTVAHSFADQLPNEADLRASYCLGVIKAVTATRKAPDTTNLTPEMAQQVLQLNLDFDRQVSSAAQKLRSYLLPRVPHLEPLGLVTATDQGASDFPRSKAAYQSCIANCGSTINCVATCGQEPLARKVRECMEEPTFLPY